MSLVHRARTFTISTTAAHDDDDDERNFRFASPYYAPFRRLRPRSRYFGARGFVDIAVPVVVIAAYV